MQSLAFGTLRKMKVTFSQPINYYFRLGEQEIFLNDCLGKNIKLNFTGEIFCIQCNRKTSKSFQQGYCYPCMSRLYECGLCVIRPEKCKAHQDYCPENDWAHEQCLKPHIVYLANSSGLKVGITRESNVINRWIDQGAKQGIPIMRVSNRYQSGLIELHLKQYVKDRTDWRKMLQKEIDSIDLQYFRNQLFNQAEEGLSRVTSQFSSEQIEFIKESDSISLSYPIIKYPEKIKTLSFDKTAEIDGRLEGIKGQYLIFDTGVINIRKFAGYQVALNFN